MSADLLAEKQRREKLEESKFELEAEVQRIKREQKLRNSLVADGLDAAKPDEIASKFSKEKSIFELFAEYINFQIIRKHFISINIKCLLFKLLNYKISRQNYSIISILLKSVF